jgi:hypothetical protein
MRPLMLLLSLGIISGCGSSRPALTFCEIRGKVSPPYCRCEDASGKQFSLTIEACDKFIAQPPLDAEKLRLYVIDLEKKAASCHKENSGM